MRKPHPTALAVLAAALPLALPGLLLGTLSPGAHAQSAIQAATTGKILEASPRAYQSAYSGAWLPQNRASSTLQMRFIDPLTPLFTNWGSVVNTDSVGWRGTHCDKQPTPPPMDPGDGKPRWQCVTRTSEDPKWSPGLGPLAASAGGSFSHESGASLRVPYNPREVRFRALDYNGARVASNGAGAESRLDQGRTTTQSWLRFTPPWQPAPGRPVCTADLVLELNYGIDGVHESDPAHAIVADRWLDLDLSYGPMGIFPGEGRGKVTIRPAGQLKTAPRGTGWPEGREDQAIQQSTIHVDTSSGSRPPLDFSWNNGTVAFAGVPFTQVFDTWTRQTVRVPVSLRVPTAFYLDALTHQRQMLGRSVTGRSAVPMTPNPAAKGHGFDVRMYLDNLQPAQCRPDYVPPRPPPREPCVPTGGVGCWRYPTGG